MSPSKSIALILLIVAASVGLLFLPVRQWFSDFETFVHALGTVGPVVYALAYVALTVLLFPASLVTVGAGTLFGLTTGLVVVLIGANLGALCSFLLARTFLRQRVTHWTESNPKFRFLDEAIGRQGFKMVLLCRLSPVFPFILLNYFLGLTAVRVAAYVLANLLGMLPAMFLLVYVGATARDALEAQPAATDFYQQALKYIGLAATVVIVVVVTRMARRALRQAEQAQEGSPGAAQPGFEENCQPTPFDRMVSVEDPHDQRLLENCRPSAWINPTPAKKYNLVVIGAGTAGLVSAAGAAGLGAKVALLERSLMGGDCLNVGCVPSKAIIRSSRAVFDINDAGRFGVRGGSPAQADFPAVMERMRNLRANLSPADSAQRFAKLGVDVFLGEASFGGPDTVKVAGQTLRFKQAVITTGARAVEPPIPGLTEAGYLTNETVFNLTQLPAKLAVVGGGPIGCELAQAFQRLGSEVSLFHKNSHLLDREDIDAAAIVQKAFVREGIALRLNVAITRVERNGGGKIIYYKAEGKEETLAVDEILIGTGRAPNVEGPNLEAVGG